VSISPFETGTFAHSHEASTDNVLAIFALGPAVPWANRSLAISCGTQSHEEREFEDGEHKTRPLVNVRDRDVYVVYALHGEESRTARTSSVACCSLSEALKDAGAARVTAVVPYLCYARKDRQTKPRDPVTTRYVAQMFEAVGTDRIVVIDIHNLAAFQNAFRRGARLSTRGDLRAYIAAEIARSRSPSSRPISAAKSARNCSATEWKAARTTGRQRLMDKHGAWERSRERFRGRRRGPRRIVLDDLISTRHHGANGAACRKHGAKKFGLSRLMALSQAAPRRYCGCAFDAFLSRHRAVAAWLNTRK